MKLYAIGKRTSEGISYDKGYTSREYAMENLELWRQKMPVDCQLNVVKREVPYVYTLTCTKVGDSVEQGIVEVYGHLEECHSYMSEVYKRAIKEAGTAVLEAWVEDTQAYYRTESYSMRWDIIVSDDIPKGCRKVKYL